MKSAKPRKGAYDVALEKACRMGHLNTVRERLEAGAAVNACNQKSPPVLFAAAATGRKAVVEVLLKAGADPNALARVQSGGVPRNSQQTPLSVAIAEDRWEVANLLVAAGADPRAPRPADDVVLGEAIEKAARHRIRSDLEFTSDRAAARLASERWTRFVGEHIRPGLYFTDHRLYLAVVADHLELVRTMLAAGVSPNVRPFVSTALEYCLQQKGMEEMFRLLLAAGADVNAAGQTPLPHAALLHNQTELLDVLLEAGANPESKATVAVESRVRVEKEAGLTSLTVEANLAEESPALIVAVRLRKLDSVRTLLQRGANPNAPDHQGVTALQWADRLGLAEIADLLRAHGAAASEFPEGSGGMALLAAASAGDLDRVKALLEKGVDPNEVVLERDSERLPLHAAAAAGHAPVVALLLERVDVNRTTQLEFVMKTTPLMLAAEHGQLKVVELLLAAGARVDARDRQYDGGGRTALHRAASAGQVEVIDALAAAKADLNVLSKEGASALLEAVLEGKVQAVAALLHHGADPNAGRTFPDDHPPLAVAAEEGRSSMVQALLAAGARIDSPKVLQLARRSKDRKTIALIEEAARRQPLPSAKPPAKARKKPRRKTVPPPNLASAGRSPSFLADVASLEKLSGATAGTLEIDGGRELRVPAEAANAWLWREHRRLLAHGSYLFRLEGRSQREHRLGILPTGDWRDVLRSVGVHGPNYGVSNEDIVAWLEEWAAREPFEIAELTSNSIGLRFLDPVRDPAGLAASASEICPDATDLGPGDEEDLAESLGKTGELFLWWD